MIDLAVKEANTGGQTVHRITSKGLKPTRGGGRHSGELEGGRVGGQGLQPQGPPPNPANPLRPSIEPFLSSLLPPLLFFLWTCCKSLGLKSFSISLSKSHTTGEERQQWRWRGGRVRGGGHTVTRPDTRSTSRNPERERDAKWSSLGLEESLFFVCWPMGSSGLNWFLCLAQEPGTSTRPGPALLLRSAQGFRSSIRWRILGFREPDHLRVQRGGGSQGFREVEELKGSRVQEGGGS